MQQITTFRDVKLFDNCLLILDIDDTTLFYNKMSNTWWKDTLELYNSKYNDFDIANKHCFNDWISIIKNDTPQHTDENGLFDLFKRGNLQNCKIIFVTARTTEIKQLTREHLKYLNIDIDLFDIYFTSGSNKAKFIQKYIDNIDEYENIVMIDDLPSNLLSMIELFGDKCVCYKFELNRGV